jgi:VWFA-related protein
VALLWVLAGQAGKSQQAQPQQAQPQQEQQQQDQDPVVQLPEQPTFRGGISFVRVDVIVTDGKGVPVTDLKQEDFEVMEDDQPQQVEQFRLIKVDGNPKPGEPPPRQLRNRDDEESEAARDDVRVYAILLDDYHVRRANSISIREPLTRFIETQLRPNDMIAVMYPLQPASDVSFTRNHASIISAIHSFEGRKYDYRPRNQLEESYSRYPTETVERIRNDVVMGALRGLSVRLGSLSERRKSIIFVSEGFTAMLPPQMRRADASMPADPRTFGIGSAAGDTPREQTAAFFAQSDVFQRMRDVFDAANRNNAAIYSLDPRGLAVFEFDLDDAQFGATPSFATDRRVLQMTTDTLRSLSEETDGRAIVNRNTLLEGLAQITRDSSYYYLMGYNSKAPTDGKFHQIKVRVKRRGVDVRARRGFWAASAADVERIANPTKEIAKPIQAAFASIAPAVQAKRYVRTWVGSQRGEGGKTRVTVVWEPMPLPPGARRDPIAGLSVLAADGTGSLVYRGRSGGNGAVNVGSGPGSVRPPGPAAGAASGGASAPQQVTFDAPPGKLELRLTVEGADGAGTLDRDTQTVDIPDFSAPQPSLSTPRVYRGRTARDLQSVQSDGAALPAITREFSRTERLLIRFDAYVPGTEQAAPTARLLNRAGDKMQDLTVAPATAGGTHQLEVGLNSMPPGEYLVELTLPGATDATSSLIAFRVGS